MPPPSPSASARFTGSSPGLTLKPTEQQINKWFAAGASLCRDKACDRAGEVRSIVVVAAEGAQVLVAGEFRHRAHIALGPLERSRDREMAQPLRTDRKPGLGSELAHDVVDRRTGQTLPFAGPVEIDKQRTGFGAAGLEPGGERGPGWLRQAHQLLFL